MTFDDAQRQEQRECRNENDALLARVAELEKALGEIAEASYPSPHELHGCNNFERDRKWKLAVMRRDKIAKQALAATSREGVK